MPTVPTKEPRVLFWDIESTALTATFGTILCIGYKFKGDKRVRVPTILDGDSKDMLDDKALVQSFAEVLNECDYHVTWYGERFDKKMISSKLIKYGLPPLSPKAHLDLWKVARKNFKLHSNRLATWEQFLGCKDSKSPIDFDAWLRAAMGHLPSLKEVKEHCRLDVLVLEQVFDKMRPWIENEPVRRLFNPGEHHMSCIACGSHNVQSRGLYVAISRRYRRWQCTDCGKWQKTRIAEKDPMLGYVATAT